MRCTISDDTFKSPSSGCCFETYVTTGYSELVILRLTLSAHTPKLSPVADVLPLSLSLCVWMSWRERWKIPLAICESATHCFGGESWKRGEKVKH